MISVDWDEMPKFTSVPDVFILKYLKDAPGEYVKIYLYLLMLSQKKDNSVSGEDLGRFFMISDDELFSALKYWEKRKLLDLYYRDRKISGIHLHLNAFEKARETHRLDQSRLKTLMESNPDAGRLMFVTEKYFGRPLTATEMSTLLYFLDELKFSFDLCDYLVQYCVAKGHTSIRYIEKVGLAWHKNGYTTPDDAKDQVANWSKIHFDVLKAFGIRNRNPIQKEIEYIDRWYRDYGFSMEMIAEACSISLRVTGQQSFEYADGILSRWHAEGVRTPEDAKKRSGEFKSRQKENGGVKNQFHHFSQRSDDLGELERKLDRQFAETDE